MTCLRSMALRNSSFDKVKAWHYKLEKILPAGVIFHLFLDSEKDGNLIVFKDSQKMAHARKFEKDVALVFKNVAFVLNQTVIQFPKAY